MQEQNGDNKMISNRGIIIGSIIIFSMFLLITLSAAKFAMKLSKQTEQNFADAVRVMQGEK